MTKFFNKFKIFEAKKMFLGNPTLSHTTSYGFLATCQNLEKTNYTIPRNHPDRQNDGQTLFYRTFLVTARGPIKCLL